eukprot:5781870-Prymnesium_polylepis.1
MQRRVSMHVPAARCRQQTGSSALCDAVGDGPPRRPPSDGGAWTVVLKLHGRVDANMLSRARQYHEVLGEQLLLLYDASTSAQDPTPEKAMPRLRQLGARLCRWDFASFLAAFPKLVREHSKLERTRQERPTFPGQTQRFLSRHVFVAAPLLMLAQGVMRGCPWKLSNHTWLVEEDAIFTGNVRRFFEAFEEERADLLATDYMLADPSFHFTRLKWHQGVGDAVPFDVSTGHRIAHHGKQLPTWACDGWHQFAPDTKQPAWCADASRVAALRGWVWRSISVERLSRRLILHIAARVKDAGAALTGELFESSVCLNETSWCTVADWAFGTVRDRRPSYPWPAVGYRSEHYLFHPSKLGTAPPIRTNSVWYHPVKGAPRFGHRDR